jgi:hypothetical protein
MNATTDTTTPKAPPAWTLRPPMAPAAVAGELEAYAHRRRDAASREIDADVRAGLLASAAHMEAAASYARDPRMVPLELTERMADYASARYGCAKATTEPSLRARYMDEAHTFREAVRHLKGGE